MAQFIQIYFMSSDDWKKAAPPYTGTLLPVIANAFPHEVDLEKCDVLRLERIVEDLMRQGNQMNIWINQACAKFEGQFPEMLASIQARQARLQKICDELEAFEAKQRKEETPALEEPFQDDDEPIVTPQTEAAAKDSTQEEQDQQQKQEQEEAKDSPNAQRSRMRARELEKQQARFKKVATRIKALYRKIVMLTHEERHGKDTYLRELFDLATFAREHEDEAALTGVLDLAQKYHTKQGRIYVLQFLRQKRDALKANVSSLRSQLRQLEGSPHYKIHRLLKAGKGDEAEAIFRMLLENQIMALNVQIQNQEMRLSRVTGRFSDGSTRMQFRI